MCERIGILAVISTNILLRHNVEYNLGEFFEAERSQNAQEGVLRNKNGQISGRRYVKMKNFGII